MGGYNRRETKPTMCTGTCDSGSSFRTRFRRSSNAQPYTGGFKILFRFEVTA